MQVETQLKRQKVLTMLNDDFFLPPGCALRNFRHFRKEPAELRDQWVRTNLDTNNNYRDEDLNSQAL